MQSQALPSAEEVARIYRLEWDGSLQTMNLEEVGFSMQEILQLTQEPILQNCLYLSEPCRMFTGSAPWILHPETGRVYSKSAEETLRYNLEVNGNLKRRGLNSLAPSGKVALAPLKRLVASVKGSENDLSLEAAYAFFLENNASHKDFRDHAVRCGMSIDYHVLSSAIQRIDEFYSAIRA